MHGIGRRTDRNRSDTGFVAGVRGSVVDGVFDSRLPDVISGECGNVRIEVISQPDERTVRGIALTPARAVCSADREDGNRS